ncbi:potassium channel family protein [Pontibacter anaerobius]|uniref:Potassium channel family protein n=1 Tax=Pontibacter anaerobius TaxID=2993940 RepID=A0ABT3RGE0_9BACT|nr:potassium channel family protein [Pontibacter anaerobius]MCX2740840.1 potassium channel family protein [Pontibacter anaerobius]
MGILLFVLTVMDLIKTTFSSNGGGKITNAVSKGVWKLFFAASGKNGKSGLLSYAGPAVLISVLLVWIIGLWSGLFLMLLSDKNSIVNSSTLAVTTPLEKLYYAGFTLSTLGVGDYKATTDAWRIITSLAAFSGLAFITASITYFVPVLSAVGLQSKLSLYISGMGKTPQQLLLNSWNGKDFSNFFDNVSDLCQMLMQHTMNHHSYPVIHYFHNNQVKLAIAPAIVLLDEAYHLLKHTTAKDELKMEMLQTSLDTYLETMQESFLKNATAHSNAPTPDLAQLQKQGLLTESTEQVKRVFQQEQKDRRQLLTALLEKDGWSWEQVYSSGG